MFQNVAYRVTVYRTGDLSLLFLAKTKKIVKMDFTDGEYGNIGCGVSSFELQKKCRFR